MKTRWIGIPENATVGNLVDEIIQSVNTGDEEVILSVSRGVGRVRVVTSRDLTVDELAAIALAIGAHDPTKPLPREARERRRAEARAMLKKASLPQMRQILADILDGVI